MRMKSSGTLNWSCSYVGNRNANWLVQRQDARGIVVHSADANEKLERHPQPFYVFHVSYKIICICKIYSDLDKCYIVHATY